MKSRSHYFFVGCAVAAIVLCLAAPYFRRDDNFPYVGKWVGQVDNANGRSHLVSVEFTKDHKCYLRSSNQELSDKFVASYHMEGEAAILNYGFSNLRIDGIKQYSVFRDRVVPSQNGNTLTLEAIDVIYRDTRTRAVKKVYKFNWRIELHRSK